MPKGILQMGLSGTLFFTLGSAFVGMVSARFFPKMDFLSADFVGATINAPFWLFKGSTLGYSRLT